MERFSPLSAFTPPLVSLLWGLPRCCPLRWGGISGGGDLFTCQPHPVEHEVLEGRGASSRSFTSSSVAPAPRGAWQAHARPHAQMSASAPARVGVAAVHSLPRSGPPWDLLPPEHFRFTDDGF